MANYNGLTSAKAVLDALKTKVTAVQWTPDGGDPEPAFKKVELFDITDLTAAFQELLAFSDRCCFIVLDQESFTSRKQGTFLYVRQTRDVSLLIADRSFAKRQTAIEGDGTKTAGVLVLKDLVLPAVTGLLMAGVYCQPAHGQFMQIQNKQREDLAGRVAFALDFQVNGGEMQYDLGSQPIP